MRMYEPTDIPGEYVVLDSETTGVEPETYILTAVGIGSTQDDVEVYHIEDNDEEPELIKWIGGKLDSYSTKNVVCWNAQFDFRFIRTRAMIWGIPDPLRGYEMVDDALWFKKFTEMDRNNLEHVARALGMGTKVGRGHEMPKLFHQGKHDKIVDHCKRDVELTIRVHERILETEGFREPKPRKKEADSSVPAPESG